MTKTTQFLTPEQQETYREQYLSQYEKGEQDAFLIVVERTQLDPFTGQIYPVPRKVKVGGVEKTSLSWMVSINGLRLNAQRTGEYQGQTQVEWCGKDGVWKNVWLSQDPPSASRVGVYRNGFKEPLYAVANWEAYVQTTYNKKGDKVPNRFWAIMGPHQISKCVEALALRKAFPQELSGLYIEEESAVIDNDQTPEEIQAEMEKVMEAHDKKREEESENVRLNPPKEGERKKDDSFGWMIYHGGLWTVDPDQSDPKPDFMEYKITCMKTEMFKDKKLSELTEGELIDLKDNWIDQYGDKIEKDPVKKECAENIKKAIAWYGEQRKKNEK